MNRTTKATEAATRIRVTRRRGIEAMRRAGMSANEIAVVVGRTTHAVRQAHRKSDQNDDKTMGLTPTGAPSVTDTAEWA